MRSQVLLKIGLAREEEPQEAQALSPQGLIDAEEDEVVLEPGLPDHTIQEPPPRGDQLQSVLGRIVVPGDSIVIQECEQAVAIPLESPLVSPGDLRTAGP